MHLRSRLTLAGLLSIMAGVGPAVTGVIFTDTTFNPVNYVSSPVFSSDPSASIVSTFSPANCSLHPPSLRRATADIHSCRRAREYYLYL